MTAGFSQSCVLMGGPPATETLGCWSASGWGCAEDDCISWFGGHRSNKTIENSPIKILELNNTLCH